FFGRVRRPEAGRDAGRAGGPAAHRHDGRPLLGAGPVRPGAVGQDLAQLRHHLRQRHADGGRVAGRRGVAAGPAAGLRRRAGRSQRGDVVRRRGFELRGPGRGRAGGRPVPGFRPAVRGRGRGRARQDARRESLDTGGGGEGARGVSAMPTGDRPVRSLTLAAEPEAARRGGEGRPPAAGNRRRRRRKGLALLTAFSMWWNALFSVGALAQVIPDGRTETYVETVGSVTDVTTRTVIGSAGLNSFRTFDVGAGATVNLHLPSGAGSLVNIVTGGRRSFIDGTVNALRDGRIGGNVYFLNPDGIVVGPDGVINAGARALLTPTREFVDGFFAGAAAGTAAAVSRVLDGAVPVDPAGLISVRGQVRTAGDVDVRAGSVGITGEIRTGTVFVGQQPQAGLGDVINI